MKTGAVTVTTTGTITATGCYIKHAEHGRTETAVEMTGEVEQNEYDESGLPGPGAPTPLSALEVSGIPFIGEGVLTV